ncbi:alpha,alpha-trehalase nth1 [Pestalotiopsis sp. IQ-011]
MAASLGILKSLPCPAGDSCTAFQCLFKHPKDPAAVADEAVNPAQPTDGNSTSSVILEEGPRKRVKLSTTSSADDEPTLPKSGGSTTAKSRASDDKPVVTATNLSTRPISPPPVWRSPLRATPVPEVKAASAKVAAKNETSISPRTAANSGGTSSQKAPTTAATRVPAKKTGPTKPETLNPRHLAKAPAPHGIRLQLVKLLHAQYERLNNELKKAATSDESPLIMSQQQLIIQALDEEERVAINKPTIHGNVVKNTIMRYKKMSLDQWKKERVEAVEKASGVISPPKEAAKTIDTGLTPIQEVNLLPRISSALTGLEQYGYVSTVPKEADVEKARQAVAASGNIEVCDRCTRRFTVFPGRREEDGALASGGPCIHHPGKTYFIEGPSGDRSSSSKKWRCCDQSVGDTDGCVTGKNHVFKTSDPNRLGSVLQFAETPPNPDAPKDRAVCFDCEMGYTVHGMELIRLTAVSWTSGDELLDVLVYPVGEYIDLNSRYSGVRPEDMAEAQRWKPGDDAAPTVIPSADASKPPQRKLKIVPSPKDARDLFFSLISPETPLIGHGLENDLNALRVVHPIIADSILLYPHKRGLPVRNGLKWLTETILGRKIQVTSNSDGEVQGHDSAEDARAAGDLIRLKIRNEWRSLKAAGWTIADDGTITGPQAEEEWTYVAGKKAKRVV